MLVGDLPTLQSESRQIKRRGGSRGICGSNSGEDGL
jgi:hypothetical protein